VSGRRERNEPRGQPAARCQATISGVVSNPLGDLPGIWNDVPESTVGIVQPGQDGLRPFTPPA
jgi:hypothetical protein